MLKSQGIIADDSPEEIARIFHTVEGLSKVTTPPCDPPGPSAFFSWHALPRRPSPLASQA